MAGDAAYKVTIFSSYLNTMHSSGIHEEPDQHRFSLSLSLSPNPTAGVDITSIAKVGAKDKPAATTANALCIDDGIDEADHRTAARFPFFELPRGLSDEIYDLVTMCEETLYCDITLTAGGTSRKITYVDRGDRRAFSKSQFEVEYSAAIERRVKSLIAGRGRNGFQL